MQISKIQIIAAMLLLPVTAIGQAPNIIPTPAEYVSAQGSIRVPTVISLGGNAKEDATAFLKMHSLDTEMASKPWLNVDIEPTMSPESYTLDITPDAVVIKAADKAAVMYGIETLTQIIDQANNGIISACTISDQPRMAYRGLMLDVVRCYLPVDELKKFVDVAAQLKLNKLHLHLTDDNGWRLEVKQYPKLTEVGAWRVDRPELFPGRANPQEGEPTTYGGYYTQDEMRELVRYAAERQIDIIPEIEMPAHAIGAIASYPELTCPVNNEFIGVLPGIGGKAASIIMCAGKDSTLKFVTDVLDEVMEIFPSEYIHLGGDEADKTNWKKCDLCKKRIADQHLDGFEELQAWFMDSINSYVRQHGRTAIGWDEVTYGKPKEDMVIMGWQGDGGVAVKYARDTGRRFIMTPAKSTYLIRYQGPQWFEPFTYFGNITLKDAYEFEPVKPDWTDAMRSQLWGIQGSMWTEFCRTPQDVQHQVFPRMLAIADVAWRPEGTSDWKGFVAGADSFLKRLDDADITWAKSMYNIQHTLTPNGDGTVTLEAECIRQDATILVANTPDGDYPKTYTEPIQLDGSGSLFLHTVTPDGKEGETLMLDIDFNKATGRQVKAEGCSNGRAQVLTNGIRGSKRSSDFEWASWSGKDAEFVVDLGSVQSVDRVSLGVLGNANMMATLPPVVNIYIADDNNDFRLIKTIETPEDEVFPLDTYVKTYVADGLNASGRYIKVHAQNPMKIPAGYPREYNTAAIFLDEIIVE